MNSTDSNVTIVPSTGCFRLDENGSEIVEFDSPLPIDYVAVLALHQILNSAICIVAVILNFLLSVVIYKTKSEVVLMRPVLLANSIVDCCWAIICLISARFRFTGYRRYLFFANNPMITNRQLTTVFMVSINVLTNLSWDLQPLIFVYRWWIAKQGHQPRGFTLFFILFTWSAYELVHLYQTLIGSSNYVVPSQRFLSDSDVLLKQYNYVVKSDKIYGYVISVARFFNLESVFLLINFAFILISLLGTRYKLRSVMFTSTRTRQMERSLNQMLVVFALIPLISNVIPSILITQSIPICKHYPYLNLLSILLVASAPLISPISTFWFIRPYRNGLKHLMSGDFATFFKNPQANSNSLQYHSNYPSNRTLHL